MREMTISERKEIEGLVYEIFSKAVTSDYARYMLEEEDECTENTMMEDIIRNVLATSAWEEDGYYSDDDVRLAIGRELMARLGVDY